MFDETFWKTIIPKELLRPVMNHPDIREVPIPSAHGFGTAASVAKLYGIIANGGSYKGKRYFSQDQIDTFDKKVVEGQDCIMKAVSHIFSKGFWLVPNGDESGFYFGTGGAGGQMAFGDLKHKLGFGYVSNFHKSHMFVEEYRELSRAMYDSVIELEQN